MRTAGVTIAAMLAAAALASGETRLFVLAGQSNMTGVGRPFEFPEKYEASPTNLVYYLGTWEFLEKMAPSEQPDVWGPEVSFAHEICRLRPEDVVVVLKFTWNDSSMDAWRKDYWSARFRRPNDAPRSCYTQMVNYANAVLEREGATLAAIVWFQGESDELTARDGNEYEQLFSSFISDLRNEWKRGDLPFVFGRIRKLSEEVAVRRAQERVAATLPGVAMVDTDKLPLQDPFHLGPEASIRLGILFADACQELLEAAVADGGREAAP